jgi:CHRD domain/PEP-CTERM motif
MKIEKLIPFGILFAAGSLFAGPITYEVFMNGPSESPANASPGTGFAVIIIDSTANTLNIVSDTFSGLLGGTTASHIHCCTALPDAGTAGVATQTPSFSGFPLGVTSGSYSMIFDMTQASTWNPAFIAAEGGTAAGAEAALIAGAAAGEAYLNIHSTVVPGGEIRGFLVQVPEPGTLSFAVVGLAGMFLASKRRRATEVKSF